MVGGDLWQPEQVFSGTAMTLDAHQSVEDPSPSLLSPLPSHRGKKVRLTEVLLSP